MCIGRCNRNGRCGTLQRAHNTAEVQDLAESAKQQLVRWQIKKREEIARLNEQV